MGFKEEIRAEASRRAGLNITQADMNYYLGSEETKKNNGEPVFVYWNDKENEFEYRYNGKLTEFRWLKGKAYYDRCKTPQIAREFFSFVTAKNNGMIEENLEDIL